jgi:hypothetical protein
MENVRLPRHAIDRLETRWAGRLRQEVKAWSGSRRRSARQMQTDGARVIPVIVKRARGASVRLA